MRVAVGWFILVAPLAILLGDAILWWRWGVTITGVVREWAARSPWPEVIFVVGTAALYFHFFRGVPEVFWEGK